MTSSHAAVANEPAIAEVPSTIATRAMSSPCRHTTSRTTHSRTVWLLASLILVLASGVVMGFGLLYVSLLMELGSPAYQ